MNLPDRLLALADSLEGDQWEHPLLSREACLEAAAFIEQSEKALRWAAGAASRRGKFLYQCGPGDRYAVSGTSGAASDTPLGAILNARNSEKEEAVRGDGA